MEQEPTPIIELLELILFLGSITYLLGILFQGYILFKNKKSIWVSTVIILVTRIFTVPGTLFILAFQNYPISPLFVSVTAVLPELIFSILILKIFGNKIRIAKKSVRNRRNKTRDDQ